jgi:(5-formylfuran-3-yl)methyl phosphate synthase
MTKMLASVTSVAEAKLALELGADIIDLKNPAAGALGALPEATIREIVRFVDARRPTSATIGDLPPRREHLCEAVRATANCGVDFVKVGFFTPGEQVAYVRALANETTDTQLVAVLFADLKPDLTVLDALAAVGFRGAMLDTASKESGALRDCLDDALLAQFVRRARTLGLFAGLAGSLTLDDIEPLLALDADYLGFRGALCADRERTASIDRTAFVRVRSRIALAERLARR